MNTPLGPVFDTNLLSTPTPRRLMSLWMEVAGREVAIVPTVLRELRRESDIGDETNRLHRQAWGAVVGNARTPYTAIAMTPLAEERKRSILQTFDLRCFPSLGAHRDIQDHNDAHILAEGLALHTEVVVTNNMRSIDHDEVNDLMARAHGRNSAAVLTADQAMLAAHRGGDSSKHLLTMALASAWPDDGRRLVINECRNLLMTLRQRLEGGVNMPDVSQRLLNAFEVDDDLEQVIDQARRVAGQSSALRCELVRARWMRDKRVSPCDLGEAHRQRTR